MSEKQTVHHTRYLDSPSNEPYTTLIVCNLSSVKIMQPAYKRLVIILLRQLSNTGIDTNMIKIN